MLPGVRTMPAAMVLPTAAAMPNHMPRTCRRRPRFFAARAASKAGFVAEALLGSRPLAVAGGSGVFDKTAAQRPERGLARPWGRGGWAPIRGGGGEKKKESKEGGEERREE